VAGWDSQQATIRESIGIFMARQTLAWQQGSGQSSGNRSVAGIVASTQSPTNRFTPGAR